MKCVITIHDAENMQGETAMAQAVLTRLARHVHATGAETIDIYATERNAETGWIEWIVTIVYISGSKLTIGAIQREVGGEFEFHS